MTLKRFDLIKHKLQDAYAMIETSPLNKIAGILHANPARADDMMESIDKALTDLEVARQEFTGER